MGMFDSFYGARGDEWQTKALDRTLRRYRVGDAVEFPLADCQFQVIGGEHPGYKWRFATVRAGRLEAVPVERDKTLPLVEYAGFVQEMEQ